MLATRLGRAPACRAIHSLVGQQAGAQDVASGVRRLMRSVPQQVALVVATMPDGSLHGATISSFTSISLHPEPLVAFSLRTPSRLVSALTARREPNERDERGGSTESSEGQLVTISLLSTANQALAQAFSKPGADHGRIFSQPDLWRRITESGSASSTAFPPGVADSMGSMACSIKMQLSWGAAIGTEREEKDNESITFIARVMASSGTGEGDREPLLYCDRRYIRAGEVLEDPPCVEEVDDPVVA